MASREAGLGGVWRLLIQVRNDEARTILCDSESRTLERLSANCPIVPFTGYGGTRFFIIRSSSAHNVNVAIDKGVWATIQRNEQKLAQAVMVKETLARKAKQLTSRSADYAVV